MRITIRAEGPRACGKTYLLKQLEEFLKYNYCVVDFIESTRKTHIRTRNIAQYSEEIVLEMKL